MKKGKKYTYKTEASRAKAQARGKAFQASLSLEEKRERYMNMRAGLDVYREAKKLSKENALYKEYFDEIQRLRAQAKKLGKTLNLSNVTGAPSQLIGTDVKAEARIALGLAGRIDAQKLFDHMVSVDVFKQYKTKKKGIEREGYFTYNGKAYLKEELVLMCSAPKKFFAKDSPFWNEIQKQYDTVGELYVSEIFGS